MHKFCFDGFAVLPYEVQILCLKTDFAQRFGGFTLLNFVGLQNFVELHLSQLTYQLTRNSEGK